MLPHQYLQYIDLATFSLPITPIKIYLKSVIIIFLLHTSSTHCTHMPKSKLHINSIFCLLCLHTHGWNEWIKTEILAHWSRFQFIITKVKWALCVACCPTRYNTGLAGTAPGSVNFLRKKNCIQLCVSCFTSYFFLVNRG